MSAVAPQYRGIKRPSQRRRLPVSPTLPTPHTLASHTYADMSFHQSAEDVRVDDGHILRARIPNANGDMVDAECDLDQCLGNNNGTFWRPGQLGHHD